MMSRLASAAVAIACLVFANGARAQSASDLLVRIDQLENQVRQLTGMVEQAQYRNQQLEASLRRMQEDYDFRLQELGSRGGSRTATPRPQANAAPLVGAAAGAPSPIAAPPPLAASPPPPVVAAPPPGRRSDAFDPNEHPGAPGAPRSLGSVYANAPRTDGGASSPGRRSDVFDPNEHASAPGAPLDLTTMAAPGNVEPGRPAAPTAVPRASGTPGTYAVATAPPSSSPRDTFDLGYGYLQRKDYPLAEDTFRDFLKRYPSDRLASEAQYWLGESLFQRQAFRDAADAFLIMSKKYEGSVRAPDSLLRLGQSLAAINEKELACATLGEVVRKYPRASANVKQTVEREQKRVHC
jgi:tol-pal system protein YbgF